MEIPSSPFINLYDPQTQVWTLIAKHYLLCIEKSSPFLIKSSYIDSTD